jgi:flagellar biosynthesis/type III secretory pathway M-ring protein FliF/YscJ
MFGLSGIEGFFMLVLTFLPYLIGAVALWIGWRFVRLRERQALEARAERQLEQRVQLLEEMLTRMSTQVEQVTQGQEFVAKLLESRAKEPPRAR